MMYLRSAKHDAWSNTIPKDPNTLVTSDLVNNNNNNIVENHEDWIDFLLTEGRNVGHDAGCGSKENMEPINEAVVQAGRKYFKANFFSLLVNMMVGLYSLMFIQPIARVLQMTGRSSSPSAAFRRYLETIRHSLSWFQDQDSLTRSLSSVLVMHRAASNRSRNAQGAEITQTDMVLTQFGFIGPYLLFPHNLGISGTNEEGDRGLIYIFYLVGRSLGIQDRFNLCHGDPQLVRQRCTAILRKVIQPSLIDCSELSLDMADHLLEGIIVLNPFIVKQAFRTWTERLLLEKELSAETKLTGFARLMYSVQIFVFQIVMHMPLNAWTKFLFNKLLLLDLWLGHEWIDFIVQNYKKSQDECSLLERITGVAVIPVMIVRSVSVHLAIYIRDFLNANKLKVRD